MSKKIKAVFSKTGDMRFISHLDLVRVFHRASRRSAIPVGMTQGFNPRLKISITKALKLGVESKSEESLFVIDGDISIDNFVKLMNEKLPNGINIIKAEEIS